MTLKRKIYRTGGFFNSICVKKTILFSHLYFINCKLPFAGRKSIIFFLSSKGGPLIAGGKSLFFLSSKGGTIGSRGKSYFFPPMSCVLFPPMLSKTLKTTHYETNHSLMFAYKTVRPFKYPWELMSVIKTIIYGLIFMKQLCHHFCCLP